MSAPELVLPIVHLNGTGKADLIEQRIAAMRALREAYKALQAMAPNGRDYYPDPGRMNRAQAQHARRCVTLDSLLREIEDEAAAIYDGPGGA